MAMKTLMIRKNITDKQKELASVVNEENGIEIRASELETAIREADTDEKRSAVESDVDALIAKKNELAEKKVALEEEIRQLESDLLEAENEQGAEPTEIEERKDEKIMTPEIKEQNKIERSAMNDFIRGIQHRDDYNMEKGNNGALIPTTIAQEIITKAANLSPLFQMAHRYDVKGKLVIPFYPASSAHVFAAAYATEFTDLESVAGDTDKVELTGYLAGSLAKISKSLINNTDVDVVPFVVDQIAHAFAAFLEKELIKGTTSKIAGLAGGVTSGVTAAGTTAITSDELIEVQASVNDVYQQNACWIMSPSTRTLLRKLKDTNGHYLLNPDMTAPFGYTLLGKPVYVSDNMDNAAAGKVAIYYGDMSGLAVKVSEDLDIEVLNERYAAQHAVGVVGWMEVDAKVENAGKIAKLTMHA